MVYTASQIIAEYISPLNNSKYIIKDTTTFPDILAENPIKEDEEDISYDVVSLFTNVWIYSRWNKYTSKKFKTHLLEQTNHEKISEETDHRLPIFHKWKINETTRRLLDEKSTFSCYIRNIHDETGERSNLSRKSYSKGMLKMYTTVKRKTKKTDYYQN